MKIDTTLLIFLFFYECRPVSVFNEIVIDMQKHYHYAGNLIKTGSNREYAFKIGNDANR